MYRTSRLLFWRLEQRLYYLKSTGNPDLSYTCYDFGKRSLHVPHSFIDVRSVKFETHLPECLLSSILHLSSFYSSLPRCSYQTLFQANCLKCFTSLYSLLIFWEKHNISWLGWCRAVKMPFLSKCLYYVRISLLAVPSFQLCVSAGLYNLYGKYFSIRLQSPFCTKPSPLVDWA